MFIFIKLIEGFIIAIGLFGMIYGFKMDKIEKKLKKTGIPVKAKIITAYSSSSKSSVTKDLSIAKYILVEVNSKKYKLWIKEKLSKNQTEVFVYTDGNHAVMYSEKKIYRNQEDKIANLMHGRLQRIVLIWSIMIIAWGCGENYYSRCSKDLEILQDAYTKKIELLTNIIDEANYTEEQKDAFMSFVPLFSGDMDSIRKSIIEMRNVDSKLINMGKDIEDRIRLTHPVWNSVLELHYSQIDETKEIIWKYMDNKIGFIETIKYIKNTSSYGNVYLSAQIYLSILFILNVFSISYIIVFIVKEILYRKMVKEFDISI